MIPAGIAFAEEEVIIIEEPVAAEEVVEEVVEVEPVEVEPVAEEDVEMVEVGQDGAAVTWGDIRKKLGKDAGEYGVLEAPSCDKDGKYRLHHADGTYTDGTIKKLGHSDDTVSTILLAVDTTGNVTIQEKMLCHAADNTTYGNYYYCAVDYDDSGKTEIDEEPYEVKGCGHILNKVDGKYVVAGDSDTTIGYIKANSPALTYAKFNSSTAPVAASTVTMWHDLKKVEIEANCLYGAGYVYKCARDDCGTYAWSANNTSTWTAADITKMATFDPAWATANNAGKTVVMAAKDDTEQTSGASINTAVYVETDTAKDKTNHRFAFSVKNTIKNEWRTDTTAVNKWEVDDDDKPTCMKTGTEVFEKCDACEQEITRVAEKVDHKMSATRVVVTPATCLANGYEGYACEYDCGYVADGAQIDAKQHTFNRETYVTAHNLTWTKVGTLSQDGEVSSNIWRTYCEEPGCDYYVDVIKSGAGEPAKDHAVGAAGGAVTSCTHPEASRITIPAVPATKTASGMSEGSYCNDCGMVVKAPQYVAPLNSGLVKDKDGNWIYAVDGKQDKTYVGMTSLDGELFFIRDGVVDTSVNGIQRPEKDGPWYFFANGQVQKGHAGFALYDGAWFYINNAGLLDESAEGYYEYDGAKFLVTGGWVRTNYTGMYPDNSAQTSFKYVNGGMWMEDFTGTVTIDGVTWNVTKGIATK